MSFLKTIDVLKSLKGKLNFLKASDQTVLDLLRLANSLASQSSQSNLSKISIQEINDLRSDTNMKRFDYDKMLFDVHVHRSTSQGTVIGTIFEELNPQQKSILKILLDYTSRLNSRQLLYLNYAVRQKINSTFPNWENIHLSPDSPYRRDLQVMPTVSAAQDLWELKAIDKKKVMPVITKVQEEAASQ